MTNNVLNDATAQVKKLRRSRSDKMLAGVCGGVAKMVGVDAAILRIILVAATLLGFGTGAVLYVAAWILMPEEDAAM
ncbi:PspC domain-containing protein [Lentzea sp. NPDC058436]|uniref:PspC domain-containing protein n=1 Tax=Lentzea sp. NPDC058436 TaxID=3346499 RepID=UPI003650FE92